MARALKTRVRSTLKAGSFPAGGSGGVCRTEPPSGILGARRSDLYFNCKAEILFNLRARLLAPERGPVLTLPNDPELLGQLTSYSMEIRSGGRIRTIDPVPSSDRADALLLTIAADAWGPSIVSLSGDPAMRRLLGY